MRRRFSTGFALTAVLVLVALVLRADETAADDRGTNVLANGSFERSLGGWRGFNAVLTRVPRSVAGKRAARVSLRGGAPDYSIYPDPRPVATTRAGDVYTARAWVRSVKPRRRLCLRIREWVAQSLVGSRQACLLSARSWRRFPRVRYTARATGNQLDVYVYEAFASPHDSFEVDGIVLFRRTAPPSPPPVANGAVLLAAGDIASCGSKGDEATANLLDRLPGTIATLGDNAYESGSPQEFADCYHPSWGRHKRRTRPSAGNHEYGTRGAAGYFGYFGAAAGERGKGYYSYELGTWHLIALNSNCGEVGGCRAGSPQERWLRADLVAHRSRCTLAYWHHPRFSSGQHGSDPAFQAFWQALFEQDADVVLVAHDHHYERFAPQTPGGALDSGRGIREFVVGTGGGSYYPIPRVAANSEVRKSDTFGVLRLVLGDAGYSWKFIPEAGKTFTDSGTESCH